MFDCYIRPYIDKPLNKIAIFFANKSIVSANVITLTGLGFGAISFICILLQQNYFALMFLLMNRLCDGLDGAVARARNEESDFGGYLDIVADFFVYAGFPFFTAIGIGTYEAIAAAAFILFSIILSGTSFLAYAVIASKKGMTTSQQGEKSFFFSRGIMEGSETILFLILICLLPNYFIILSLIFASLCILTALMRSWLAYSTF